MNCQVKPRLFVPAIVPLPGAAKVKCSVMLPEVGLVLLRNTVFQLLDESVPEEPLPPDAPEVVQVTLFAAIAVPHVSLKLAVFAFTAICNRCPGVSDVELKDTVAVGEPVVELATLITLKATEDVTVTVVCSAPRLPASSRDKTATQNNLDRLAKNVMECSLSRMAGSVEIA